MNFTLLGWSGVGCCYCGCRCRFNWCCRRPDHQRGGAEVGPWCDDLLDPRRIGAQSGVAGRTASLATLTGDERPDPDLLPRPVQLFEN